MPDLAKGPPLKGCAKYLEFEPHKPHGWEKKPGWPFHCEGILPLDEQPPCQVFISPEQPECGEAAPVKVRTKTRLIDARIDVCMAHKRQHDSTAAQRRSAHAELAHPIQQAS